MNRVVMNMDAQGCWTIYSDEPIEFFCVCDHSPRDRVYQMQVEIGVEKVRQQLLIRKPVWFRLVDRRDGLFRRQAWHRWFRFWRGHWVYSHIVLLLKPTGFKAAKFRRVVA